MFLFIVGVLFVLYLVASFVQGYNETNTHFKVRDIEKNQRTNMQAQIEPQTEEDKELAKLRKEKEKLKLQKEIEELKK